MFQILNAKHLACCNLGVCQPFPWGAFWQPSSPGIQRVGDRGHIPVGRQCKWCYKRSAVPAKNCVAPSISQKVGCYWGVLKVRVSWSAYDFPSKSALVCRMASFQSPLLIFVVFPSKQTQFCITWIVFSSPPTCMGSITAVLEFLSLSSVFPHCAPKTCFLNFTAGELE